MPWRKGQEKIGEVEKDKEQPITKAALKDEIIKLGMKIGDVRQSIKELKISLGAADRVGYGTSEFKKVIEKRIGKLESENTALEKRQKAFNVASEFLNLGSKPWEVKTFLEEQEKLLQKEALSEEKKEPEIIENKEEKGGEGELKKAREEVKKAYRGEEPPDVFEGIEEGEKES